jgi:hypothetical protein
MGIATTHGSDELFAAGAVEVHDDARPLVALVSP